MKTPFSDQIKAEIMQNGPLTLARYMQLCLTDPVHGYYTAGHPIGVNGDFITAPEISQLFGELIGIWIIDIWQKMESPQEVVLAEAGPGHGTLMADILRTLQKLDPACLKALKPHLVEISPLLKETQQKTLSAFATQITWLDHIEALPPGPMLFIANEFFDALPVQQFQYTNERWAERTIGLDESDSLKWGLTPAWFSPPDGLTPENNAIFETCDPAQRIISNIANRLKHNGGAALVIDYGHLKSTFGDTFQAVSCHQYCDPFETPGKADLTVHVDFEPLVTIAKQAGLTVETISQGQFLLKTGLLERAGQLGASSTIATQEKIRNDVERLAAADKMGDLFKVMAITANGIVPHGFI